MTYRLLWSIDNYQLEIDQHEKRIYGLVYNINLGVALSMLEVGIAEEWEVWSARLRELMISEECKDYTNIIDSFYESFLHGETPEEAWKTEKSYAWGD